MSQIMNLRNYETDVDGDEGEDEELRDDKQGSAMRCEDKQKGEEERKGREGRHEMKRREMDGNGSNDLRVRRTTRTTRRTPRERMDGAARRGYEGCDTQPNATR